MGIMDILPVFFWFALSWIIVNVTVTNYPFFFVDKVILSNILQFPSCQRWLKVKILRTKVFKVSVSFTEPLPSPANVKSGCRFAAMEPHPVHPWRMNLLPASHTCSAASPIQRGHMACLSQSRKSDVFGHLSAFHWAVQQRGYLGLNPWK